MKKIFLVFCCLILVGPTAHADWFGADLAYLAQIVNNTLGTLNALSAQNEYWNEDMAGINDKIERLQTIKNLVQPSSWKKWRNPQEALRRLKLIYDTMPPEYRSKKSNLIENEISNAMILVSQVSPDARSAYKSGKELERRGENASPGVAEKLTASGVGSMLQVQSQTLILESHITSLLAQMLAEANERETRSVVSRGSTFRSVSRSLTGKQSSFSREVLGFRAVL